MLQKRGCGDGNNFWKRQEHQFVTDASGLPGSGGQSSWGELMSLLQNYKSLRLLRLVQLFQPSLCMLHDIFISCYHAWAWHMLCLQTWYTTDVTPLNWILSICNADRLHANFLLHHMVCMLAFWVVLVKRVERCHDNRDSQLSQTCHHAWLYDCHQN